LAAIAGKHLLLGAVAGASLDLAQATGDTPWSCLAWHPGGDVLALGHRTGARVLLADGTTVGDLDSGGSPVLSLAWRPDGLLLAAGCHDQSTIVWNTLRGQRITLPGASAAVTSLAWAADGAFLVTNGGAEPIGWDLAGEHPSMANIRFTPHLGDVVAVAALGDDTLISAAQDGTLVRWRIGTAPKPTGHVMAREAFTAVAVADGRVAFGDLRGEVGIGRW
jgi:WD40 repeat protein